MLEDHTYHLKIDEHYMLTGLCSPVERERQVVKRSQRTRCFEEQKKVSGGEISRRLQPNETQEGGQQQVPELQKAKFSVCSTRRCPAV